MTKICVCTLAINDWYREIVKYSLRNMKNYCDKHNYSFYWEGDEIYDNERDPPWYKIKLIQKLLQKKEYDVIVWIDADSHILDMDVKLEKYLDMMTDDIQILIGAENNNPVIFNTGVMFIKNNIFSERNRVFADSRSRYSEVS